MNVELTWAEWIGDILSERRWSQEELAERAGISQSAVSGWFTKGSRPNRITCSAIARALDIPTEVVLRAAGHSRKVAPTAPPPRSESVAPRPTFSEEQSAYDAGGEARIYAAIQGQLDALDITDLDRAAVMRHLQLAVEEKRRLDNEKP